MGVPRGTRDPRDSMKSTWRTDRSQWGPAHWLIHILNIYPYDLDKPIPVFKKSDPISPLSDWSCQVWICVHAVWPVLLQRLYVSWSGQNLHPAALFAFYLVAFQMNSVHELHILRRLGHRFGFFDGDKPRDGVPDHAVLKVLTSLQLITIVRPIIAIILSYRRSAPVALSWWLPVELALYSVILDGWFYLYHRSCHELDSLWRYHRTHHLTKHPNPLLSSYADAEQEFLEIAIIPLLTYVTLKLVGFPMGFYDWWFCHQYIVFTEAFGHSGLRLFSYSAGPIGWLLSMFNCELTVEDHDLHHRKGWRNSYNYGKQTRVWDRMFGTCFERLEGDKSNIDWDNVVHMPLI